MDAPMAMDELARCMPLNQFIPITDAAEILGGGSSRINALMDAVQTGRLKSWSHGTEESALCTTINGEEKWAPDITPDTDPATVLLDSEDVLRQWCGELENRLHRVGSKELAPYIDARLATLNARTHELKTSTSPAPAVEQTPPTAPAWIVNKPQRNTGYNWPLYRLLSEAHREGLPRPTARDVIEAWRSNKPKEIEEVMGDGIKYLDSKGNTKAADDEHIRKVILRMTQPPDNADKRPITPIS